MTIHERVRNAGRSLRREVELGTDTEAALQRVLAAESGGGARRWRWLPAAAAVVLVAAGATAVSLNGNDGGDDDEVAIEIDGPEPDVAMQLLAPDDGRESVQLPVSLDASTDLVDGQEVRVEAAGFEPGESVGVVQCVDEAAPPARMGIDACLINPFVQLVADGNGTVAGEYEVRRFLTVPVAGTVDCAAVAERCLIGVGALANYDRSGGHRLTFAATGDGIEVPVLEVATADGLADGQLVRVTGHGFEAGTTIGLEVCSVSPAICAVTGDPRAAAADDGEEGEAYPASLVVDGDGRVDGEVPLWRFLPGFDAGTYVDCTVSTCALRVTAPLAPAPRPLTFAGGEVAPAAPSVTVEPNEDLAPGDHVQVLGQGFRPGTGFISLCARQPAEVASPAPGVGGRPYEECLSLDEDDGANDGVIEVGDDGVLDVGVRLGAFDPISTCGSDCGVLTPDATWTYTLVFHPEAGDPTSASVAERSFQPPPVVLDYVP